MQYELINISRDGVLDSSAMIFVTNFGFNPLCKSMLTTNVKQTPGASGTTAPQGFKESVIEFEVKAMVIENNLVTSLYSDNLFKITITC